METHLKKSRIHRLMILAALGSVLLAGCSKNPDITSENATEVALDNAGLLPDQVTNLNTTEADGGYSVSFQTEKGSFHYVIGNNGKIVDRTMTKADSGEKEETPNPLKDSSKAADSADQTDNTTQSSQTKETETETATYTPEEQEALDLACSNAGLTEADVTNIGIDHDGTTYRVVFQYRDTVFDVMVDMAAKRVLSTGFR